MRPVRFEPALPLGHLILMVMIAALIGSWLAVGHS